MMSGSACFQLCFGISCSFKRQKIESLTCFSMKHVCFNDCFKIFNGFVHWLCIDRVQPYIMRGPGLADDHNSMDEMDKRQFLLF